MLSPRCAMLFLRRLIPGASNCRDHRGPSRLPPAPAQHGVWTMPKAPAPPQPTHPQLFQALDALADAILPDADDGAAERRIPGEGVDRENFLRHLRGAEATLAKSPSWPLLVELRSRVKTLIDALQAAPNGVVIPLKAGHDLRVLVWSAHEQERRRRARWSVPVPTHDLHMALAAQTAQDRGNAVRLLWIAANPRYRDAARMLRAAVASGRGAADLVSWQFLEENPPDRVQSAANCIAADVVVGRRNLPRTLAETADAMAEALGHADGPAGSDQRPEIARPAAPSATSAAPKRSRIEKHDGNVNLLVSALVDQNLRLLPVKQLAERLGIPRTTLLRLLEGSDDRLSALVRRREDDLCDDKCARARTKDARARKGATDWADLEELNPRDDD